MTSIIQLLFLLLVGVVLFVLPVWLLVIGIRRLRAKRGGAVRIAIATVWLLFTAFIVDSFCPWHETILDSGTTPDGRPYALIQMYDGEPYTVHLYVRSDEAGWVFHYVDHEVFPWRFGGHVEFSPDSATARVFCGRKVYKTIDISTGGETSSNECRFPSAATAEDLFRELTRSSP